MPTSTYELCKRLAARGKLTPTLLDLYAAAEHITQEQYRELVELIKQ